MKSGKKNTTRGKRNESALSIPEGKRGGGEKNATWYPLGGAGTKERSERPKNRDQAIKNPYSQ